MVERVFWIDVDNYIGPDRRTRGAPRLLDRRRFNAAQEAPSLAALLRQLQIGLLDVQLGEVAAAPKIRARVQALIALARQRGENGAVVWLESLEQRLAQIESGQPKIFAGDLVTRYLQSAMAALK